MVGITAASPSKLGPRYFGPYQVVERLGAVAYRLQLPPKARIHDVFHVALLKKYEGEPPASIMPLPDILRGRRSYYFSGSTSSPEPRSLGALGALGWSFCSRCYLGAGCRLQRALPNISARGRAVCWGGGKCCGLLPRPPLQAPDQASSS